jgi:hypothetical protein
MQFGNIYYIQKNAKNFVIFAQQEIFLDISERYNISISL